MNGTLELKLTEKQMRDLQSFLGDAPMRGADWSRFGAIVAAINEAQAEYQKKVSSLLKKEVEAQVTP